MIQAILVDDKPTNAKTLYALIQNYCPGVTVSGMVHSLEEAFELIHLQMPDIVFLDIEMPSGSGFDLLKRFKVLPFEVIFTTAYNQYAIEAFRQNVLDYLLKPINILDLQEAVLKAEKQINLKKTNEYLTRYLKPLQMLAPGKISLPTQGGYLFVSPQDIIRCEASGSYSNFHMNSGKKIVVSMLLKKCEELLPTELFLRVHNSHVINVQYVQQYIKGRGGYLLMQDGSQIEVSDSRKNFFLESMMKQG